MKGHTAVYIFLALAAAFSTGATAHAALQLKLVATNYNPVSGVWTDSSGRNNHATQGNAAYRPSLVVNQTTNGSAVVRFDGVDDCFSLTTPISTTSANGFTILAYVRSRSGTLAGGDLGSFQYRIVGAGVQEVLEAGLYSRGTSSIALSATRFSNINAKANNAGGSLRLNGAADGTLTAQQAAPYENITAIGKKVGATGEYYIGDMVELRIYDQQLSLAEIQAVEAEFTAAYENSTQFLSLPVLVNPTFDVDAVNFSTLNGVCGQGGNPAQITGWAGTGGRGINPGNGAGTAFRDNGSNATHVAFLQGVGSVSNLISGLQVGNSYRFTFEYNGRNVGSDPAMSATIGGTSLVDSVIPPVNNLNVGTFAYYTANILINAAHAEEYLTISQTISGDNTLLFDNIRVFHAGPDISNNGFESPVQPNNSFELADGTGAGTLAGSSWTITGTAGITRNGSAYQTPMYASEGNQFGLIPGVGSFVQTVTGFSSGDQYSLSLLAMKRTNGGVGGNNLQVVLDAGLATEIVLINISEVTAPCFKEETASFTAHKSSYTLTIRSTNPLGGDRTTFIDNVWFNKLTSLGLQGSVYLTR